MEIPAFLTFSKPIKSQTPALVRDVSSRLSLNRHISPSSIIAMNFQLFIRDVIEGSFAQQLELAL